MATPPKFAPSLKNLTGPHAAKLLQLHADFYKKHPNKGVIEVTHDGPKTAGKNKGA